MPKTSSTGNKPVTKGRKIEEKNVTVPPKGEKVVKPEPQTANDEDKENTLEIATASGRKKKPPLINIYFTDAKRDDHPMIPIPRPPRSVEVRGGDVLGSCECLRRNGLQQDCPKWSCRGDDLCLSWPVPTCQPSGLGVPIIIESRVKKPEAAHCEVLPAEKRLAEKKAAEERKKEEVSFVVRARANWAEGKKEAAHQKAVKADYGYNKCRVHSMYRLVPPTKNEKTQTSIPNETKETITLKDPKDKQPQAALKSP